MKKYIIIILLTIGSLAIAEVRTDNNQTTWFMGFAMASIYDVWWAMPSQRNMEMSPADLFFTGPKYQSDVRYVNSQKSKYVMSKISIGLLTGSALSFYNAQKYDRNPSWDDVVFGGLGGLTSVVIHF